MLGHQFHIPEAPEGHVTLWVRGRIEAITLCLSSALPENALTLIYSGIDTLGFLDAPARQQWATQASFEDWARCYVLPSLTPVVGGSPTPVDLYGARCGILHTSSSSSRLGRKGIAREIWYEFRRRSAVNLSLNASGLPLLIDVDQFADAFQSGADQFIVDIRGDSSRLARAEGRAGQFFAWGIRSPAPP